MCGIFFCYSKKGGLDLQICKSSLNLLEQRGPDYSFYNLLFNGKIFFGQTTLSITSPESINYKNIQNAHNSSNKKFNILFNGEIYNYLELKKEYLQTKNISFSSNTDTEILINLFNYYDHKFITKKLYGMYAYVVYDEKKKKIYISRDHIGEKILYYYSDDNDTIISSEINAILNYKKNIKISRKNLKNYFYTRHLNLFEETIFKDIYTFDPGSFNVLNLENGSLNKTIDFSSANFVSENKYRKYEKLKLHKHINKLNRTIIKNIDLLTPKINFKIVCSGGIDSTLISSYFFNNKSYSPEFIALNFNNKDSSIKNLIGIENKFDLRIKVKNIDIDEFTNYFNLVYKYNASPLATHSFISQYIITKYCKLKCNKVLLTGDGSDEIFGGYKSFNLKNLKKFNFDENGTIYSGITNSKSYFQNHNLEEYRAKFKKKWRELFNKYHFIENKFDRKINTMLLMDTLIELEATAIRSSDMMGMANNVECRSPFLTKEIMQMAFNLPLKYKINFKAKKNLQNKYLLKKLFSKIVGKEFITKKEGFSGFPNEAGKMLLNNKYKLTKEYLGIKESDALKISKNKSLEWKLINSEMFLKNFRSYM